MEAACSGFIAFESGTSAKISCAVTEDSIKQDDSMQSQKIQLSRMIQTLEQTLLTRYFFWFWGFQRGDKCYHLLALQISHQICHQFVNKTLKPTKLLVGQEVKSQICTKQSNLFKSQILWVTVIQQHPPVHHPGGVCYYSIVDEPQLSSYLVSPWKPILGEIGPIYR